MRVAASRVQRPPTVGATARVQVAVACGWRSPEAPRDLDAQALASPVDLRAWLSALDDDGKRDLVGRIDTQLLLGDAATVLAIEGAWARVAAPDQPTPDDARGYPVWLPIAHLAAAAMPAAATGTKTVATVIAPTAELVSDGQPPEISFGTRLPVVDLDGAVVDVRLPGGETGRLGRQAVAIHDPGEPALVPAAASIIAVARQFVGLPYLWAGTSGFGFDCSGFVHLVHRVHGISLPRDTGPQSDVGQLVEPDARRAGDLVFFERAGDVHHVAIWIGDGLVLEAPKTGLPIRVIALGDLPYASEVTLTRRIV